MEPPFLQTPSVNLQEKLVLFAFEPLLADLARQWWLDLGGGSEVGGALKLYVEGQYMSS